MHDIFYDILKHNNVSISSFPADNQSIQIVKFDDLNKINTYLLYSFDKIYKDEAEAEKMHIEVNNMLHKTPIYVPFFCGYKRIPLFEIYSNDFIPFFKEEDATAYIYKYGEEPVKLLQDLYSHNIYQLTIQLDNEELKIQDYVKNQEYRNYAVKFMEFLDKNQIILHDANVKGVYNKEFNTFDTIYCYHHTDILSGNFNDIKVIILKPIKVSITSGDFKYIEIEPAKARVEYIDCYREEATCYIKYKCNIDTLVINRLTTLINNNINLHIKNLVINDNVHYTVLEHLNSRYTVPFIDNYICHGKKVTEQEFFEACLKDTDVALYLFDTYIHPMMEDYLINNNVSKIKKYIAEKDNYSYCSTSISFKYVYKLAFDAKTIFEETLKYHNCPYINNKYFINKCPFDLDIIVNKLNNNLKEAYTIFIPFVKSKGKYIPFSTKISEGFMYFWDLDMGDYILENI